MNLLVQVGENLHFGGFKPFFEKLGYTWVPWEERHTPAFDVFDEVKPTLFLGDYKRSDALQRCLSEYNIPSVLEQNPFEFHVGLNHDFPREKQCFRYLILVEDKQGEGIGSGFECEISCCELITPFIEKVCFPIGKFNVKVTQKFPHSLPQYIGRISNQQKLQLYRASKIGFANSIDEIANIIGCGVICLTNSDGNIREFGGVIGPFYVDSPEEFYDECHLLLNNPELYSETLLRQKMFIENNRLTYKCAFEDISEALKA